MRITTRAPARHAKPRPMTARPPVDAGFNRTGPFTPEGDGTPGCYKEEEHLVSTRLAPAQCLETSGVKGMLLSLARTYNRLGGLLEALGEVAGLDPVAMLAVWQVESGGRTFTPGRAVLRFENHKLFKYWGASHRLLFDRHFRFGGRLGIAGRPHQHHQFRPIEAKPWQWNHVDDQDVEYSAYKLAGSLAGDEAASLSASWGGPQIMGFNHRACGYPSARALADAFQVDERWHVLAFADFCRSHDLIAIMRRLDWFTFGQRYNGDGAGYGPRIARAFALKSALRSLPPRRPCRA